MSDRDIVSLLTLKSKEFSATPGRKFAADRLSMTQYN